MGDRYTIVNDGNGNIDHIGPINRNYGNIGHYVSGFTSQDMAIVEELQGLRHRLTQTDPMIANAIESLEEAIREQNQTKLSKIVRDLMTGTVGSVISNLASAKLSQYLGSFIAG